MHPYPDRPLPEGWVYIEHPEHGQAENAVSVKSLPIWEKAGWTEVPADAAVAPVADPATGAAPRRARTAAAADQAKEV